MMKKCPNCGTIVTVEPGETPVCPNCGYGSPGGPRAPVARASSEEPRDHVTLAQLAAKVQHFDWRRLMFIGPALAFVSEGRFFARSTAIALRVLAAVVVLGGLVAWIGAWAEVRPPSFDPFSGEPPLSTGDKVGHVIGWIIVQLFSLAAIYMVAHLLVIRARTIAALPNNQFTVIPICSVLLRLIGESWAAIAVAVGLGGGIMTMMAGGFPGAGLLSALPFLGGASGGFVGGLLFMATAAVLAAGVLLLFYFLAEAVVVMVEIAKNTAAMRRRTSRPDEDLLEEVPS